MPRSARNKVVSLTQIEKKGRENKERIADEIRAAMDAFEHIWVLDVQNMRNTFLKEIRQAWQGSKILFGRTKLMQKVIGRSAEDEYLENSHELSGVLSGDVGLLFTNEKPQVVIDYFESFIKKDYARSGQRSPVEFIVPEGIVYSTGGQIAHSDDVPLVHSLESTIRQLGMPTRLDKGKVVLAVPFTICREGQVLDSKQTRLLKQFGVACSEFKVDLKGHFSKIDAKFTYANSRLTPQRGLAITISLPRNFASNGSLRSLEGSLSWRPHKREQQDAQLNYRRVTYEKALQLEPRDLRQWLRYVYLELEAGNIENARSVIERALIVDYTYVPFWYQYAKFEAQAKQFENSRAVLLRALKLLPLESKIWLTLLEYEELRDNIQYCEETFEQWHSIGGVEVYKPWYYFAQRHSNVRISSTEILRLWKRADPGSDVAESLLSGKVTGLDDDEDESDHGQDIELWWTSLDECISVPKFERAIKSSLPTTKYKTDQWRMYALLWLRYAFYTEGLEASDSGTNIERPNSTVEIYERSLKCFDHRVFTSVTLWGNYIDLLIRRHEPLEKCRKLFGSALGKTKANRNGYEKILKKYIDFETRLCQFERVRKLYLILCAEFPHSSTHWVSFAMFEADNNEHDRACAIFEAALHLELDSVDDVWMSYFDYKADIDADGARSIGRRAVIRTKSKADMYAYVAMFEIGHGLDNSEEHLQDYVVQRARSIFEEGFRALKNESQQRLEIFDLYIQFEENYGNNTSLQSLLAKSPKQIKHIGADGEAIYSYEFIESDNKEMGIDKPDNELSVKTQGLQGSAMERLLANAQKWKANQNTNN